jgi:predicted TIM-barrel fold metal-dependent hydrolase
MPLLPDPEPREQQYRVFSVDDHLCEPRDIFEGRLPASLAGEAPYVAELDGGTEVWVFEGQQLPNIGLNAVAGRPKDEWNFEPSRFDEMRKGAWNVDARVSDMDIAGIDVALCFPSLITGFAGTRFARSKNPQLGEALVRAWNDWMNDVWAGSYPDRFVKLQVTWLQDPQVAAQMIYDNAARGFKAVTFPESVSIIGFPSIHTTHWDPFFRACEETETVICLHTGTGEWRATLSPEAPIEQATMLFPACGLASAADFLWSKIPVRFPNVKIALSEGGIGWVAMAIDRLRFMEEHELGSVGTHWGEQDVSPSEAFRRNFWFCTIDDPSTVSTIDVIGDDHVMLEVDYPHASTTWPDTQWFIEDRLGKLPRAKIDKITYQNAVDLFRHPMPAR